MTTASHNSFIPQGSIVMTVPATPANNPPRARSQQPTDGNRSQGSAMPGSSEAWCRVDAAHQRPGGLASPKFHGTRPGGISAADSVSFDVGPWTSADDWLANSPVLNSTIQHAAPAEGARPETAVADSAEDHHAHSTHAPASHLPSAPAGRTSAEDDVPPNRVPAWTAEWEVDEFLWPEELSRFGPDQVEYFRYAGEKLRDASREGLKALAVVSTRDQEGCTTMAVCLARAASAAGARVALVDANLANPNLGPSLGVDFSGGWQAALSGQSSLGEAAVLDVASQVTLLPLAASHQLPTLANPYISDCIGALAKTFDLVILDAGPVGADEPKFCSGADCPVNAVLVVRDVRRTSEPETVATASRLKQLGIPAVGIAENFLPALGNRTAAA